VLNFPIMCSVPGNTTFRIYMLVVHVINKNGNMVSLSSIQHVRS